MTWVAVAIGGAAVIGGVASNMAAGKQASGQRQAAQTQADMFNTIVGQENPFVTSGYGAQAELNALMGLGAPAYNPQIPQAGGNPADGSAAPAAGPFGTANSGGWTMGGDGRMIQLAQAVSPSGTAGPTPGASPSGTQYEYNGGTVGTTGLPTGYLTQTFNPTQQQLENYPGYQFQLSQGDLAVNSANSAGGSALSGAALKNLMTFNQGLAASNYQNYFNQFQTQQSNIFNRLNEIATRGQNAAGNLGTAGTQLGTGIAQAQAAAAGSMAGGIVGTANAVGGSAVPLAYMMSQNQNPGYTAQDYATMQQPGFGSAGSMPAGGGYTFTYGGS